MPATPVEARWRLLPMARAVSELPRVTLDSAEALRLLQGQRISAPIGMEGTEAAIFDDAGRLLAIAEVADGLLHATKGLVDVRTC